MRNIKDVKFRKLNFLHAIDIHFSKGEKVNG